MFYTFEAKYLNQFKPSFVVFIVFLKKSVGDLQSWLKSLIEKLSLIILFIEYDSLLSL